MIQYTYKFLFYSSLISAKEKYPSASFFAKYYFPPLRIFTDFFLPLQRLLTHVTMKCFG